MKRTGLAIALRAAIVTVGAMGIAAAPLVACSRSGGDGGDAGADAAMDAGRDGDADDGEAEAEAAPPWYALPDASVACGYKPPGDAATLPDCPLQGWMRRHARRDVSSSNMAQLMATFAAIATLAPSDEGYENWASISRDGADAARRGEIEAARAACRGCHVQYRKKYHEEIRARPLNDATLLESDASDDASTDAKRDAKPDAKH